MNWLKDGFSVSVLSTKINPITAKISAAVGLEIVIRCATPVVWCSFWLTTGSALTKKMD